jgi:hypothetical protein
VVDVGHQLVAAAEVGVAAWANGDQLVQQVLQFDQELAFGLLEVVLHRWAWNALAVFFLCLLEVNHTHGTEA